jgi:acetyl-CoA C-acetyltransferase
MAPDPRTPVLVGAGQVVNRKDPGVPLVDRPEPVELAARALLEAAHDASAGNGAAGRKLLERADSLQVAGVLSWEYRNAALLVAERLGIEPRRLGVSAVGGNTPQMLVNAAASAISRGDADVVLIAGAEAAHTRVAARRDPERPVLTWTSQPADTPEPELLGIGREPVTDAELSVGLDRPLRVFPLFENALRARRQSSIAEHQARIARLWARFSEVAARNPYAWSREPRTAEEIAEPGPANRMVAFPYPKLMNANSRVDLAGGLILCSLEAARAAGVGDDRLVFPVSGVDLLDRWFLTHRQDLHSSPALRIAGRRALELAGLGIDDVAHVDLYSCFPCAVQIAAEALDLPVDDPDRELTVTGGLTFAGGPGNAYMLHSIATLARLLRQDPGTTGLVSGIGWYLSKHTVGLWSATPSGGGFRSESPQQEVDMLPQRVPAGGYEGEAEVETYTVLHDRTGERERAIIALLTPDGARAWATSTDPSTLEELETSEGCGRKARLGPDGIAHLH